jgi:hypothetical protein
VANLQTTGQISILNLANAFGGSAPHSMNEYYRGGGLVPSIIRDPTSGTYYSLTNPEYYWYIDTSGSPDYLIIRYNNVNLFGENVASGTTSYTSGGYTYYRGTFLYYDGYGGDFFSYHREQSVNTSVPTSGTISLSNFYDAYYP